MMMKVYAVENPKTHFLSLSPGPVNTSMQDFICEEIDGEASTRLGLAIKNELKAPVKLFLGLSGGSLGYFIPADEWESGRNGNYEESVSLGKETSGRIESALKEMKVN